MTGEDWVNLMVDFVGEHWVAFKQRAEEFGYDEPDENITTEDIIEMIKGGK